MRLILLKLLSKPQRKERSSRRSMAGRRRFYSQSCKMVEIVWWLRLALELDLASNNVRNVEVTVPTDKTGSLMSGITVRKGLVTGSEALTDLDTLVRAKVPLRNMFGFTTELRSITQVSGVLR